MDEIEKKARKLLAAELGAFPESCTREVVMTSALRAIAAALEAAREDAEPSHIRAVAKRNLRSLIKGGSSDKALMLACLEELS